tara:strand:- start:8936 stop:9223 length:288 start_codon:yes stop_codon:yes gene_type:complete
MSKLKNVLRNIDLDKNPETLEYYNNDPYGQIAAWEDSISEVTGRNISEELNNLNKSKGIISDNQLLDALLLLGLGGGGVSILSNDNPEVMYLENA